MVTIYVAEARANLSKYVEMAARGERVIICRRYMPFARLRTTARVAPALPRQLGFAEGWIVSGLESLDEPWTEEDLGGWEEKL